MGYCRDWRSQLAAMQNKIITSESNAFNVTRTDIFNGFRRGTARKNFHHLKKLDVLFVDEADIAEGSIDEGGPTREFLRLLLKDIFSSDMFEGPAHSKRLALSTICMYYYIFYTLHGVTKCYGVFVNNDGCAFLCSY